jgi:molybdopterin-guanine dinucleotide biosynthesis protein B
MTTFLKPVLGFAACSGTGKTTLLKKLIPLLRAQGLRIAVIKHSHHDFEIDTPGKDSYELRKAGAEQMLIASPYRTAVICESIQAVEPQLNDLVARLELDSIDLVLVEGFRHEAFPKLELYRVELGKPYLYQMDSSIIAVLTDTPLEVLEIPQLDINNPPEIAQYIGQWLRQQTSGGDA